MSETRSIRGEVEFDTVEFLRLLWALETDDNVILLLRSAVFQHCMLEPGAVFDDLASCIGVSNRVYRDWCLGGVNLTFEDRDRVVERLCRHFKAVLVAHLTDTETTFRLFPAEGGSASGGEGADRQRLFEIIPGLQKECSIALGIRDAIQEGKQDAALAQRPGGGWRPR